MPGPKQPRFEVSVDVRDLEEAESETPQEIATADPDLVLAEYAEMARLLRAADTAGDLDAVARLRHEMDALWPSLTQEQRDRIEDGEFDW